MDPLETAEIGSMGLRVTRLGFGGGTISGHRAKVTQDEAVQTVQRALHLGVRYFDTAPFYGRGTSEHRIGLALADVPRSDFVLSTKVGRILTPADPAQATEPSVSPPPMTVTFDFSRDGIMRSFEESLERLGLDRIDIALIHDPDDHHREALEQAYPALAELRSEGVVRAIGVGMNQWEALHRFAEEADFDCFLVAGRYTLLDQTALPKLMPLCREKGMRVIIGGPYNSGILASDLSPSATFNYTPAPPEILERARRIGRVCERHGVALKAAALQFVLAHPAVASVIPGSASLPELEENIEMVRAPIPSDFWEELRDEQLIPEEAPVPAAG